jgi:cardiolipin synthase
LIGGFAAFDIPAACAVPVSALATTVPAYNRAMPAWFAELQTLVPHLTLVLSLLWGAYLLVLAIWIVLQKREPVATLSWLLALAALPVLGFLIYHFFGPQRIRRQRLRRLRARAALDAPAAAVQAREDADALGRLLATATEYLPSDAQDARLLVDGAETFDALCADIAAARHSVHLAYYIFNADRTGTRVRDALAERARAGLQVRLLLDAVGSIGTSDAFLAPLRAAGAEVVFFHRLRLRWRRLWRPKLNLRYHRKLAILDGRVGYTGGINITDEEDERLCAEAYHDLHARIEGRAVRWLQLAFLEDWSYASNRAPRDEGLWPALPEGRVQVQVVPSGPDNPREPIHLAFVAAIHAAHRRVWLATPYFVPGEAARMALAAAALRGVDVRVLLPARSDSRLVTAAARSYYEELAACGMRILEYPRMQHAKALLVDDDLALLGSANFDHRSFRLNFELSLLLRDAGFAATLATALERDFALAATVPSPRTLSAPQRLAEATARLLSPLL